MICDSPDYTINRAIDKIKLAQQGYKRELKKKDDTIQALKDKIETLQAENRDYVRINEKESRELFSSNQALNQELLQIQEENERLKEEMSSLEDDQIKANHIIRHLLRKVQNKQTINPQST